MSADQQADLFSGKFRRKQRPPVLGHRECHPLAAFQSCCRIQLRRRRIFMTTEFVRVPSDWTVEQKLRRIKEVGPQGNGVRDLHRDPRPSRWYTLSRTAELLTAEREGTTC